MSKHLYFLNKGRRTNKALDCYVREHNLETIVDKSAFSAYAAEDLLLYKDRSILHAIILREDSNWKDSLIASLMV